MNASAEQSVAEFYDTLAADYDQMTGFEGRFVREEPFFKTLVDEYNIGTALDAGCGTGFHSHLLAKLGVNVTAVDLSEAMLEVLHRHAAERGLSIRTVRVAFQELQSQLKATFDGVFCMGNALAHLLTTQDLRLTLGSFSKLLKPGGILVLQMLNFDRILGQRPRILSVKTSGDTVYTRYYEYADPFIKFNIAKSTKGNDQPDEVITTTLRPVLWKDLSVILKEEGFERVKNFGSISMAVY